LEKVSSVLVNVGQAPGEIKQRFVCLFEPFLQVYHRVSGHRLIEKSAMTKMLLVVLVKALLRQSSGCQVRSHQELILETNGLDTTHLLSVLNLSSEDDGAESQKHV
jgi:hypothetical protein